MSSVEILHAYRHLLRAGLRAVQFSKPARYVLCDQLRAAFRDEHGVFEKERIRRTVWFLKKAGEERGLEHRIVKNLIRVQWERKAAKTVSWRVYQTQLNMKESK